jgi:hypothetical protein
VSTFKIVWIAFAIVVVLIVGGLAYLGVRDIPAPQSRIEKIIPDERLGK